LNNIYTDTIRKIYRVLDPAERKKSFWMIVLIICNGFVELVGLAFILPLLYLAKDNSAIHTNKYLDWTYSKFQFQSEDQFLVVLIVLLLAIFLVKNGLGIYFNYVQSRYSFKISTNLTTKQFRRYLNHDFLYFKDTNSNTIMRNVATIPVDFTGLILLPIIMITTEIFVVFLISIGLLLYSPGVLLMIGGILTPVLYFFYRLVKNKIQQLGDQKNELRPITFKVIFEAIFGYVDVKLSNSESYFIKKSHNLLDRFYSILTKLYVIEYFPIRLIEMTAIFCIAILYFYFIAIGGDRSELVNFLILFSIAAYRVMPSINRIMSSIIKVKSGDYVFELLEEDIEQLANVEIDEKDKFKRIPFTKGIELKNISYTYQSKNEEVLKNISISMSKGDRIGIIGPSGSGKSTLVNVILRFLKEDEGQLLVDGVVINDENKITWRNIIGYVQQDFYMVDGSLADNIAFGENPDQMDLEKIKRCVEMVSLNEMIDDLPNGVHSQIGEFGSKISGGQRQRIAIARALYKEPEILIFDEATSSLDTKVESEILDTINKLSLNGISSIAIAHRITSLKYCDKIYELSKGEISNTYTYQELSEKLK